MSEWRNDGYKIGNFSSDQVCQLTKDGKRVIIGIYTGIEFTL